MCVRRGCFVGPIGGKERRVGFGYFGGVQENGGLCLGILGILAPLPDVGSSCYCFKSF